MISAGFLITAYDPRLSNSNAASANAAQMDAKIVLIDGDNLAQYMIDYNLGVSIQNIYEIKKMDSDYFEEE